MGPWLRLGGGNGKARRKGSIALAGILAVASVGLILSSLLGGRFNYVSHTNLSGGDSYFRFPSKWEAFSQDQVVLSSDAKITPAQLRSLDQTEWTEIFSADRGLSLANLKGLSSSTPFGVAQQLELTTQQKSTFKLAALRSIFVPNDPLSKAPSTSGYHYKVISYRQYVSSDGLTHLEMLVDVKAPGGSSSVLDEAAAVDKNTQWVYFIGIGCTYSCFEANRSQILDVVNSWNVKEQR